MRAVAVALAILVIAAGPIDAGERDVGATTVDDGDVVVSVSDDGAAGGGTGSGGALVCEYRELGPTLPDASGVPALQAAGILVEDWYYVVTCRAGGVARFTRVFQYEPGVFPVSAATLARQASALLRPAAPVVRTSPDPSVSLVVGLDTWIWAEASTYRTLEATATIPFLGVRATATPTGVRVDPGDGSPSIRCTGPGVAFDPNRPEREQSSDCTHVYRDAGDYAVTVSIVWDVAWEASDGSSGVLESVTRSSSVDVSVVGIEAVGR